MRRLRPQFALGFAFAILGTQVAAQATDTLYAGRHCDHSLLTLRAVTLSDVADSTLLINGLSAAADTTAAISRMSFSYDASGQVAKIGSDGIRHDAQEQLERDVRAAAKPVPGMPKDFSVSIVLLNRRHVVGLSPSPVTCPPDESSTAQAAQVMRQGRHSPSPAPRHALVGVWLGASGRVEDAWLVQSAGRRELDSLALVVVRVLQYKPALVGATPVGTLLEIPVRF